MLPVLIEEELDFQAAGDKQPFMAAIRGQKGSKLTLRWE